MLEFSPRTADAKGLYREMFSRPLRKSVQTNAGRVQQAGKAEYCVWYLSREGGFMSRGDEDLGTKVAEEAMALLGYGHPLLRSALAKYVFADLSGEKIYRFVVGSRPTIKYEVRAAPQRGTVTFVDRANKLDERGQTDAALDLIYDQVDALLRSGDFAQVDVVLDKVDVGSVSPDLLLGLLTATLPARTRLASRRAFFRRVEEKLKRREDWADNLLAGLEN